MICTYNVVSVALIVQSEIIAAFGDLSVECKSEVIIVLAEESLSLIAYILLRRDRIMVEKSVKFPENLLRYVLMTLGLRPVRR